MSTGEKQQSKEKKIRNKRIQIPFDMEGFRSQKKKGSRGNNIWVNVFFYLMVFFAVYVFFSAFNQSGVQKPEEIPISQVISYIRQEQVQDITVSETTLEILLTDGTEYISMKEPGTDLYDILSNTDVDTAKIKGSVKVVERVKVEEILGTIATFGIPLLILFFIIRQMKSASSDVFSFGQTRARLFNKESSKITFKDVAGIKEAKEEMVEIVDFLKNPEKYRNLGARVPRGVLLIGPAGVGKTLLAKAIAGEANVPFFSVAGSEFMEMLVGVGSSRVRDLFAKARQSQPSLIFIDEIDAIGRQRGMGLGGGHDEREQTLNQILIEMDGFDPRTNVIVLAATNRPDMLDPALVRAGRFDRRITIPMPDLDDRKEIIRIHMRGKPFAANFDIDNVAKKTVGFSGADLENMLNEAAIHAARENKNVITNEHVEEASIKVVMGPERRGKVKDAGDLKLIAYHEAGHAIVGAYIKSESAVKRISIIPRGESLGTTSIIPERDRFLYSQSELLARVCSTMGGRAAEELIFNEVTSGAANDIERATALARKMVTEFGMSALGPIHYDVSDEGGWVAKSMGATPHFSQELAAKIDVEVEKIVTSQYARAKDVLVAHKDKLEAVAETLLKKETIYEEEFRQILGFNPEGKERDKTTDAETTDN